MDLLHGGRNRARSQVALVQAVPSLTQVRLLRAISALRALTALWLLRNMVGPGFRC